MNRIDFGERIVTAPYARVRGARCASGRLPEGQGGFSILELLVVLTLISIVLGVGFSGFRSYREATVVDRAIESVAGDVRLARSFAIQRRSPVAIVVDEAARSYALRDETTMDTLVERRYDAASELPLTVLDVVDGSSLTFDSRGILSASGTVRIDVGANDNQRSIAVSRLGRTKVDPSQ